MYLYGNAAREEYRSTVPQIRSGQYENLSEKVQYNAACKCNELFSLQRKPEKRVAKFRLS